MPNFPRYTTFKPSELEEALQALTPPSNPSGQLAAAELAEAAFSPRAGRLLKEHSCSVSYPDGREGGCRYERKGPACHVFRFAYEDGSALAAEWLTRPLENTREAIEQQAQELAPTAFATAIERERREYFGRASESSARSKHPEMFQMTAQRAKEMAGKYALCQPVGQALVPVSSVFESLEVANEAWKERGDRRLVVACCNRLDRCWELPRFNPLYVAFDPRPGAEGPEKAATEEDPVHAGGENRSS